MARWLVLLFRFRQRLRQGERRNSHQPRVGLQRWKEIGAQSPGQEGQDGELPLQSAACFNVNFLQSGPENIDFFDVLSKCPHGTFTFFL